MEPPREGRKKRCQRIEVPEQRPKPERARSLGSEPFSKATRRRKQGATLSLARMRRRRINGRTGEGRGGYVQEILVRRERECEQQREILLAVQRVKDPIDQSR